MMLLRSILICMLIGLTQMGSYAQNYPCDPTPPDLLGPFYTPNAPERSLVGSGYLLTGQVKSALTCAPISEAKIEVWMAGPDGRYGDQWRATFFSLQDGTYRFSSPFPGSYGNRPPHIHLIVNAPGFQKLTTQHYSPLGAKDSVFDLILIPLQ